MARLFTGSIGGQHLVRANRFTLENADNDLLERLKAPLKPLEQENASCPLVKWYEDLSQREKKRARLHIKHLSSSYETGATSQAFDVAMRLLDSRFGMTKDVLLHVAREVVNNRWVDNTTQKRAERVLREIGTLANASFYRPRA
jgi:hypothetical protein